MVSEFVTKNENGSTTLWLEFHREHDGKTIESITVKAEPCGSDIYAMDKGKGVMEKSGMFLASVCGLPAKFIAGLHTRDFMRAQEIVAPFLDVSPATGETSTET